MSKKSMFDSDGYLIVRIKASHASTHLLFNADYIVLEEKGDLHVVKQRESNDSDNIDNLFKHTQICNVLKFLSPTYKPSLFRRFLRKLGV